MGRPDRPLHVYPDAARAQAAQRARLLAGEPPVELLTWDALVDVLGGARELSRQPCSPVTARAVLAAAAAELGPTPFGGFVHEPAFARAALDAFQDAKAGGLGPQAFLEALDALPPERQPRLEALARLYARYEARMAALGLADGEDRLRGAREALARDAWPDGWDGLTRLSVHGVYDAPPATLALLFALAEACARRGVALVLETPAGGSDEADAALAPLFRAFERRSESAAPADVLKAHVDWHERPLAQLARRLFDPDARRQLLVELAPHLSAFAAPTARDEAWALARALKRELLAGVAPDALAVAFREPGPELEWLAEACAALGVPLRVPFGEPAASVGPVRFALELALLAEDGFPAERVAALVGSRYAPALARGAPEAPARLLAEAGVRDDRLGAHAGRGAYDVRLEALARRAARRDPLRAHAARLLKERCARLLALCRAIPEEGPALALLEGWWAAATALGLPDGEGALEPRGDSDEDGLALEALLARARDDAARGVLRARVDELAHALARAGGGPRVRRRTFARWLRDAFQDVHLPPRGPQAHAVEVLDVAELPGRTFERVFVAGVCEGRLPGRAEPNALLGDTDRAALNQHLGREAFRLSGGEFEERAPWRLAGDRLLFASALASATRGVTFSFAGQGPGGQEQAPSPFLEEVRRLTGVGWEVRPPRPVPSLDEALTEAELRQRAALEALAMPRLRLTEPDVGGRLLALELHQEPWFQAARELAEVETERLRFFSEPARGAGPHTGAVRGEGLAPVLARAFRFDAERPLSASALARFGNCAFQGFLGYALGVPEPDEAGEELDARARGTFWHRVVEELFRRLVEEGHLGRPYAEVPQALVDAALETAAEATEVRGHVGHPALWQLARERARGMLKRVLGAEGAGLPFAPQAPAHFELKFGPGASEPAWARVTLEVDGAPVHFEGKIDRLDVGHGSAGVLDYKSGRLETSQRAIREALLTRDFQLPLYLFAARAAGLEATRAAWLSLRTGEALRLDEALGPAALDDLLTTDPARRAALAEAGAPNLANAVEALVRRLRQGEFAPRPRDCQRCGYRAVCRISERQLVPEEGPA